MNVLGLILASLAAAVAAGALVVQVHEQRARLVKLTAVLAKSGDQLGLRLHVFNTGPAPVVVRGAWLWTTIDRIAKPHHPDSGFKRGEVLWENSGRPLELGEHALPVRIDGRSWRTWTAGLPDAADTGALPGGDTRSFVVIHFTAGRVVTAQVHSAQHSGCDDPTPA